MTVTLLLSICQGFTAATKNTNHAAHTLRKSSMLRQAENKRSPSKVILSAENTDYPSNSLCSLVTGPISLPVEAGIRASSCHSRSEAAAVIEAQTCSSALHLQWVAGGEEIRTAKVSPTHTHTHTHTHSSEAAGLKNRFIHSFKSFVTIDDINQLFTCHQNADWFISGNDQFHCICLWEERWCADVCVCEGVYGGV